ncbi:MAG TPA: ABC transporter permease [Chloroflexia bacterium]|nr:ABC transporter permease [Chloroflexia bacterium]
MTTDNASIEGEPVLIQFELVQGISKDFNDFKILFLEQLLAIKSSFVYYIFMQTVAPFGLIFAMGHYSGYIPGNNQLIRIIAGAVTFALVTVGLTTLAEKLCRMRIQGILLYYSSLPVKKIIFILALLFSSLIILLPSVITPIISGIIIYNLNLNVSLWLPVVMLLGALSLVSVGTTVGVLIKSYELAALICNAFIILMAFASPTFIDKSLLPLPLQLLGWLLPSTYISDAITHCLLGSYDQSFFLDLLFLSVMGVTALLLTVKFLVWEAE